MKIAVQLYSLRFVIEKIGLKETLFRIYTAGYDGVEFAGFYGYSAAEVAGFYGYSAAEVAEMLKTYHLSAMGLHCSLSELINNFDMIKEFVKILDLQSLTVSSIESSRLNNDYEKVISELKQAVYNVNSISLPLCYHNHDFEFESGKNLLKNLTDDVSGLKLEADIFWMKAAGLDPLKTCQELSDKVRYLHIKELSEYGVKSPNPVVGQGVSDCFSMLKFAVDKKLDWVVLEAENFDTEEFDYIQKCHAAIKNELCRIQKCVI